MLTNLTRSNVYTGTDQSTDDILTKYDLANTLTSHHSLQIFPLIFGQKVGWRETTTTTSLVLAAPVTGLGAGCIWNLFQSILIGPLCIVIKAHF